MPTIHFVLQGKGGVGKTFTSSILAQHKLVKSGGVTCIDCDPVNASFTGFKSLEVKPLDLMEGASIDPRKFDDLIEILLSAETDVVVDNGASTFLPIVSYLQESNAIRMLKEAGKEVLLHVVITGGQSMADTLTGLDGIASTLGQEAEMIVWLNEYFGPVSIDGQGFEQTGIYAKHKARILGLVTIHQRSGATFGRDVGEMLKAKLTFEEAIMSQKFNLMAKQRIKMVKDALKIQLEGLAL